LGNEAAAKTNGATTVIKNVELADTDVYATSTKTIIKAMGDAQAIGIQEKIIGSASS
jgi:hypothetical protein